MTKHHHQSKAEQIHNKENGAAPFHFEKYPHEVKESIKTDDSQKNTMIDDGSIQIRAYQIYQEKGGNDLDNWLEAEQILRGNNLVSIGFINEPNPVI